MADEDEIDVLGGDFTLDNLLSKNESVIYGDSGLVSHNSNDLSCDCSSEWLLDQHTPTNSTCWYNNGSSDFSADLPHEHINSEQDTNSNVENQISTEHAITDDSGWTKKEKNLLERGIEIFGKSNARLSQFIGTKTPGEVKHYLKNFFTNVEVCGNINEETVVDEGIVEETIVISDNIEHHSDENEVLDDSEIPASIEEVIAAVSTAKPTVRVNLKRSKKNSNSKHPDVEIHYNDIPSGQSLLKSKVYKQMEQNFIVDVDRSKKENQNIRQREFIQHQTSLLPSKKPVQKKSGNVKFKFKTKMKIPEAKIKAKRKVSEQEVLHFNFSEEKLSAKQTIPNLNGEEVIKMKKENSEGESESDIEIDVENFNDDNEDVDKNINDSITQFSENTEPSKHNIKSKTYSSPEHLTVSENEESENKNSNNKDVSEFSDQVSKQLMSLEFPTSELMLAPDTVTELEKSVNCEFFEGRPTKTASRYLKIRNHIINAWISSKPSYVTKTSIRQGLKNCGDVNCIGRIHQFLEQIGAINFGCAQTNYVRPLYDLLLTNMPAPKEKPVKDFNIVVSKPISLTRPRIKKKFTNDGEGGCTLAHDEKGDVINTTVVNEEPVIKQRPYVKKPAIRLIYCKPFTEEHKQEYSVHLYLSALLLMDLHSHMSHTEVMGLIGGYWDPHSKTLTITLYVPCRNIAPSTTHCDMCPISQARAADIIHGEGLNILGWFHSHPTFAPEPSQQDIDTQLSVQQWIGNSQPCIGLILSPFSAHGALIASPYRCLIVAKTQELDDQYLPYKFKVDLISSNLDVNFLLSQAWRIFNAECNMVTSDRVDFHKTYFLDQSISYLDKFVSSVKMHLAKCSDVNKMTCDAIIQGFTNICYKEL